ncbi:MAG: nucleotidyltransferase domain-containing protein [Bryobacteraceae bacterium]|nr:nucleotidyltransferase domain-containing protein [Bryobacteraceae bacterium]
MSAKLVQMPQEKEEVLYAAVQALQGVSNVVAIVLGGSYARGVAVASSDLDIGIYYRAAAPLAVPEVRRVAEAIRTPGSIPVVTDLYGWGPWVNGGAWIQTPATKVDLVYRNLDQVQAVIAEGRLGVCRHDYDQQPPFGFRSVIYFGETRYCVPLYDPDGEMAKLKESVAAYPKRLKDSITQESLWGAEFSLWSCDGSASSGDVYNAAGCLSRAAQFLVQAIFALNEEYFLNDKHVRQIVDQFPIAPSDCMARIAGILSKPGRTADELCGSLESFRRLWAETIALTGGAYQPRFDLSAASTAASNAFDE